MSQLLVSIGLLIIRQGMFCLHSFILRYYSTPFNNVSVVMLISSIFRLQASKHFPSQKIFDPLKKKFHATNL